MNSLLELIQCGQSFSIFNFLEKETSQMRIAEVMTTAVKVIDSNAPLTEAAAKMKTLDVGLLPICDGDKLIGTLTDRDITVKGIAEGYDPSDTKVSDTCQQTLPTASKMTKSTKHLVLWKSGRYGDCQC
jgi:predicted transcriptional regulator